MSKFEQIKTFINVIEENSFAAAAKKHGVTTAAISRQISRLEADLGIQLLTRTTRQISLTEIGAQYYNHCKNALAELQEADAVINSSQAEPAGSLNIVSNRHFANEYLIPYLAEFMELYPKLSFHLELAERFPEFDKESVDVLFGVSLEGPPELVRKRITTTRYILCASPDYLKKYGTPQSPEELSLHQYITHSMRKPNNIIYFRANKKICLQPTLFLNDCNAMLECAIRGMGMTFLHDYIVREAIKKNLLVELLQDFKDSEKPIYLYYPHQQYLQPKIRVFIDFFTRKINKNTLIISKNDIKKS